MRSAGVEPAPPKRPAPQAGMSAIPSRARTRCSRRESNPHDRSHQGLSLARLPFRHLSEEEEQARIELAEPKKALPRFQRGPSPVGSAPNGRGGTRTHPAEARGLQPQWDPRPLSPDALRGNRTRTPEARGLEPRGSTVPPGGRTTHLDVKDEPKTTKPPEP